MRQPGALLDALGEHLHDVQLIWDVDLPVGDLPLRLVPAAHELHAHLDRHTIRQHMFHTLLPRDELRERRGFADHVFKFTVLSGGPVVEMEGVDALELLRHLQIHENVIVKRRPKSLLIDPHRSRTPRGAAQVSQ